MSNLHSMCFDSSWDEPKRWLKQRSSWWTIFAIGIVMAALLAAALFIPAVSAGLGLVVGSTFHTALVTLFCLSLSASVVTGCVIAIKYIDGTNDLANQLKAEKDKVRNDRTLSETEKSNILSKLENTVNGSVDDPISIIPSNFDPSHYAGSLVKFLVKWGLIVGGGIVGYKLLTRN